MQRARVCGTTLRWGWTAQRLSLGRWPSMSRCAEVRRRWISSTRFTTRLRRRTFATSPRATLWTTIAQLLRWPLRRKIRRRETNAAQTAYLARYCRHHACRPGGRSEQQAYESCRDEKRFADEPFTADHIPNSFHDRIGFGSQRQGRCGRADRRHAGRGRYALKDLSRDYGSHVPDGHFFRLANRQRNDSFHRHYPPR